MTKLPESELERNRQATRALDHDILGRLNQRFALSSELRSLRESAVNPALIDVGEETWLQELTEATQGPLPAESLRTIFRAIRAEARSVEQLVRVSYLGPDGGFGHQLAKAYFGSSALLEESPAATDALDQLMRGRVAFAVVPLESSLDGLVQPSVTALARTDLPIVAERSIAANYSLMNTGGPNRIERILVAPPAYAACERFLRAEFPDVEVVDVRSATLAAQRAKAGEGACIVPEGCGRDFELTLVRANVSDVSDVGHRYAIVGTRPAMRTGNDTTCLLFGGDDTPGALHGIVGQFAERGINLKKLQSRPNNSDSWEYVFYVEVAGHISDRAVVTALEAVKRTTKYVKVLGSFPSEH